MRNGAKYEVSGCKMEDRYRYQFIDCWRIVKITRYTLRGEAARASRGCSDPPPRPHETSRNINFEAGAAERPSLLGDYRRAPFCQGSLILLGRI